MCNFNISTKYYEINIYIIMVGTWLYGFHVTPCGEQGKMEETSCEIICDAPTRFAVKG